MNVEMRLMSLLQNGLSNSPGHRNPYTTITGHQSSSILHKQGVFTLNLFPLPILRSHTLNLRVHDQTHNWRIHDYPHTSRWGGRPHCLAAQSICHHIRFTRVVKDLTIIVLDYNRPPVLPHVYVGLNHDVPQTLVIRIYSTSDPVQIMPPNLESENHRSQLKIVRRVSRLMRLHVTTKNFDQFKIFEKQPDSIKDITKRFSIQFILDIPRISSQYNHEERYDHAFALPRSPEEPEKH